MAAFARPSPVSGLFPRVQVGLVQGVPACCCFFGTPYLSSRLMGYGGGRLTCSGCEEMQALPSENLQRR